MLDIFRFLRSNTVLYTPADSLKKGFNFMGQQLVKLIIYSNMFQRGPLTIIILFIQ